MFAAIFEGYINFAIVYRSWENAIDLFGNGHPRERRVDVFTTLLFYCSPAKKLQIALSLFADFR